MNWKLWLQGLAAAAISGAATGATQVITSTNGQVNTGTGIVAGMGALVGTLLYLVKSPLTPAPAAPPIAPIEPPKQ